MPKFLQVVLAISLSSSFPLTYAETTFYDGQDSPESSGWLIYGQFPFPESLLPSSLPAIPSSLKSFIAPLAEGVGSPSLNTDLGSAEKGYAGYSNYRYVLPELSVTSLLGGASKIKEFLYSGSFEPVNAENPVFDNNNGFDIAFNVALTQESSNPNRAGFNVLVIADDGKGIELGFKKDETAGHIFAQSEKFEEAESTFSLDLSSSTEYVLTIKENRYTLFANTKKILSGSLRQYGFDPNTFSPPLPMNPYTTPNFLFLGDDTNQGYSSFTLGKISMNLHTTMPTLGQAHATNAQGDQIETTTQFTGGITINGQPPQIKIVQNLSDEVEVSGEMSIDAQHVGQLADIVVYASYKPAVDSPKEAEIFYMLDQNKNILSWDGAPEHLVGFQPDVTLSASQFVEAYQGKFLLPGYLCISFGYLLREEGSIITNDQCIEVTIKE